MTDTGKRKLKNVKDCLNVYNTNTYKGAATPVSVKFFMTLGTLRYYYCSKQNDH